MARKPVTLRQICALAALAATSMAPLDAHGAPAKSRAPLHAQRAPTKPLRAAAVSGDDAPSANAVPNLSSASADKVVRWVTDTHDNGQFPFIVVDKVAAQIWVFDRSGQLLAQAPALVGIAKGDDSAPGVGDRELSHIPVSQRTTPAGRFVAMFGPAAGHKEQMLWVDLRDAISLHPVVTANPKEHRLQRLASPASADNRITFGCINVARVLYNQVIEPLFRPAGGVVYVLPEQRSLSKVFAGLAADDTEVPPAFDTVFSDFEPPAQRRP